MLMMVGLKTTGTPWHPGISQHCSLQDVELLFLILQFITFYFKKINKSVSLTLNHDTCQKMFSHEGIFVLSSGTDSSEIHADVIKLKVKECLCICNTF